MAFTTAEGRRELLDAVAEATDAIGAALAALGVAYERLDEQTADRLEEELFRPVQIAYGRAKRTHADFAARHGLPSRPFPSTAPPGSSRGAREAVDAAVAAATRADDLLAQLQDSMLPVEVGDAELRAGLADVRERVGDLRARARPLLRTLGR